MYDPRKNNPTYLKINWIEVRICEITPNTNYEVLIGVA